MQLKLLAMTLKEMASKIAKQSSIHITLYSELESKISKILNISSSAVHSFIKAILT